ncbi:MAG: hypothetical protein NVV74_09795 [Magnetospirillum sp.]|nr:hypothetical protein [Magnetospirillum sp.]
MLHIKDIEAFAHINEALARDHAAARGEKATRRGILRPIIPQCIRRC